MTQNNYQYLLIGNGRLAFHLKHYFNHLNIPYHNWNRQDNHKKYLLQLCDEATHILLAISDHAIDPFIEQHLIKTHPHLCFVHFSGCFKSQYAHSAHPLQTFRPTSHYTLTTYKKIPFVLIKNNLSFHQLLPGLTNPFYYINASEKPYYHALCVLANNFSTILWNQFFNEMQSRFNISKKDLMPFLNQTFINLAEEGHKALTGPLVRGDTEVLHSDLDALKGDPFYGVFKAFLDSQIMEKLNEIRS